LALAPLAQESAALLACGERSLLASWSAGHLWGVVNRAPEEVHVLLVGRRCKPKRGVRIHTVSELDPRDVRVRNGIPMTSPARTLIDIAADAAADELECAVSEARALKLIGDGDLEAALMRAGRRAGTRALRSLLNAEHGSGFTRSRAERLMRRLTRDARLPPPICNAWVIGLEVDFLWPAQRLVLEVDSYQFHGHRAAFERDRAKGMALVAAGYRLIRVTWLQLKTKPLMVAALLAQALVRGTRDAH
jgi:very-short-patch-repair endonuclease